MRTTPSTLIFADGEWRRDWYDRFEDRSFADWLRSHGIRAPIFEYREGIYRMLVQRPLFPDHQLPRGYWYKGGCARAVLQRRLGLAVIPPNDVDLLVDEAVAVKPVPHDTLPIDKPDDIEYQRSWPSIQTSDDLDDDYPDPPLVQQDRFEEYFYTRDFSVNEVLANDKEVYFTTAALMDAVDRHIVATPSAHDEVLKFPGKAVKLFAKALRFSLEWSQTDPDHPWTINKHLLLDSADQELVHANSFFLLLSLDKLLSRDPRLAHQYLLAWQDLGLFPEVRNTFEFALVLFSRTRRDYIPASPYLREHWDEILQEVDRHPLLTSPTSIDLE